MNNCLTNLLREARGASPQHHFNTLGQLCKELLRDPNTSGRSEESKSARSVFIFGLYLVVLGIILLVAPNYLLGIFAVPSTNEVWIQVVGMLVLFLGVYYTQAARKEMTDFFRWTVYLRSTVIIFFVVFVLLDFVSSPLILFGLVDLLGAIWTGLALRSTQTA